MFLQVASALPHSSRCNSCGLCVGLFGQRSLPFFDCGGHRVYAGSLTCGDAQLDQRHELLGVGSPPACSPVETCRPVQIGKRTGTDNYYACDHTSNSNHQSTTLVIAIALVCNGSQLLRQAPMLHTQPAERISTNFAILPAGLLSGQDCQYCSHPCCT